MAKTLEKILSKLDGYLMSITRNIDTGMYELEVGFRKNWVFKSNDDVKCNTTIESDNGSMVTISGKHDEVTIDDLVDYVNRIIETNQKITDMQDKFEKQLEEQKKKIEEQILQFEDEMEEFKESSLSSINEKKNELVGEEFMDDDVLVQKLV